MTGGGKNQHGREELRVGGDCWMELNGKEAFWVRGKIQKKRSKSEDWLFFFSISPEGCCSPLLSRT